MIKRKSFRIKKSTKIPKSLLAKADAKFSWRIRRRDGKCMFPDCKVTDLAKLQCSHFHGRANKSTRFYDDNAITFCYWHHYGSKMLGMEYQKQQREIHGWDGQYTILMKKRLGLTRWNKLAKKAAQKNAHSKYSAELRSCKPVR